MLIRLIYIRCPESPYQFYFRRKASSLPTFESRRNKCLSYLEKYVKIRLEELNHVYTNNEIDKNVKYEFIQ